MRFFKPEQDSNKSEADKEQQTKSTVDEIVKDVVEYKRAKEERAEKIFEVIRQTSYMV